jgi:FtsH-binding integral membrane protein
MVFFAMVGIIVLSLVNIFFIESSFVSLAISFAVVLIMGAFMLSQMSAIINVLFVIGNNDTNIGTIPFFINHKKGWFFVE